MNYTLHYNNLIERAKTRTIAGYTEKHHIVPHCIGSKRIKTPKGEFPSRKTAAEFYNVATNTLGVWIIRFPDKFLYI